ncbi:MAG TPA: class I tRNA ligase family protein, partial [Vicinamibacteria bacterium]|nr:class I tRNA ligase family protein [Vicinamibacteria bacterium]
ELIVSRTDPAACPRCGGKALVQETDVLDTWFSSGLFPFSTLGWPEETRELRTFYPTTLLVTGYDILFFWVARMMMMGLHFMKKVPFRQVFLHAIVTDEHGEKMSKVKGNVVDPLDVSGRHGTDALRFTLVALAAPGTDPSFGESRLLGYKAFVNKLWNASRFLLLNLQGERAPVGDPATLPLASRWILSRLRQAAQGADEALEGFRFDQAANDLYHFVWDELCDWYIEIAKAYLAAPETAARTRGVLVEVLDATLRLLHPIIPYVTEEIWQRLPDRAEGASLMAAPYLALEAARADEAAEAGMGALMRLVVSIRTIRATYEVDRKRRIEVTVVAPAPADRAFLEEQGGIIRSLAGLARLDVLASAPPAPPGTIQQPVEGWELRLPMAGLFDVAAEQGRLAKERGKLGGELEGLRKKLENPQFVERAK